jgi:hypothetical protein
MILCQQRASDLSTNPDLKDKLEWKLFAWVCEDCKNLTLLLCRSVGLVSGTAGWFLPSWETINKWNSHGLNIIVFPSDDLTTNHIFTIDGTPHDSPFSTPSISEKEKETEDFIEEMRQNNQLISLTKHEASIWTAEINQIHQKHLSELLQNTIELIKMRQSSWKETTWLLYSAILQKRNWLDPENQQKIKEETGFWI